MKCSKEEFIMQCIGFYDNYQSKGKKLKHIDVVYEKINTSEEIKLIFIGEFESISLNYGADENENFEELDIYECIFAMTNIRIVCGCQTMFGEKFLSIPLDHIRQVTSSGYYFENSKCKFDTTDGAFTVEFEENDYINKIVNQANAVLFDYSYNYGSFNEKDDYKADILNNFEEIKKLKELLDIGAISQDEYTKIKKKLLDF